MGNIWQPKSMYWKQDTQIKAIVHVHAVMGAKLHSRRYLHSIIILYICIDSMSAVIRGSPTESGLYAEVCTIVISIVILS